MTSPETSGKPDELDDLVLLQLSEAERKRSAVYLDGMLRPAGRALVGRQEVQLRQPRFVAFVDQRPGANWAHPCRYLLVDPASRDVESVTGDGPPVFGVLASSWRLVWRSPGIDDWRLIPISHQNPEQIHQETKDNP